MATDAYTLIRRVRVPVGEVSADARSRRRRTIPADQLALALGGACDHAWAVSFIVTNIPTSTAGDVVEVEAWFRSRTDIEERFREAKLGAGLNHLPSGDAGVNAVWMWGALLAGAFSVMLQSLAGLDDHGRARHSRLRHDLLRVPARVIRHARRITLRLLPGRQLLPAVLAKLRAIPAPT
ncbi:MAG: transposase [Marmoricola sp.]